VNREGAAASASGWKEDVDDSSSSFELTATKGETLV
jgi:hypothetical protein